MHFRQCALFRVLKAYSNYNAQVGYCQGMASVVATMLTFFDEEVSNDQDITSGYLIRNGGLRRICRFTEAFFHFVSGFESL